MGLLSFIYWLVLTGPRPARRETADCTVPKLMRGEFNEEFFDAISPHCELHPVRSEISKSRRR